MTDSPALRESWVVGVIVAISVAAAALDGGAYDLVVRQQGALVLWWSVALAVLLGLLPRARPGAAGMLVIAALLLMFGWTAASLAWTSSAERTLVEIARVSAHLGVLLVVVTAVDRRAWRAVAAGATVAAVGICLYALATRLSHSFPGSHRDIAAFAGAQRLSAPFDYWNALGAWAGMTTILCLGWSAHARPRWVRGAALASVPLTVLVSYLTFSRASLGGTVIGLGVLVATSRHRWTLLANTLGAAVGAVICVAVARGTPAIEAGTGTRSAGRVVLVLVACSLAAAGIAMVTARLDRVAVPRARARRLSIIGAPLAFAAVAVVLVAAAPHIRESFTTTQSTTAATDPAARLTNLNGTRHLVWAVALRNFDRHPLDGSGAGTFEFTWNRAARGTESIRDGHSLYLEPMSELGLPGLLVVLALVAGAVWAAATALRRAEDALDRGVAAAVGAAVIVFFVDAGVDWLWESTAVALLALVLVGAAILGAARAASQARLVWRLPVAVFAIAMCAVQLPGLVSTSELRRSENLDAHGDFEAALNRAGDAIDAQPWAASPYVQRALIEEQRSQLSAARSDLVRAASREPEDWRVPVILARVDAEAGDAPAALASLRRARRLRPRGTFFTAG